MKGIMPLFFAHEMIQQSASFMLLALAVTPRVVLIPLIL